MYEDPKKRATVPALGAVNRMESQKGGGRDELLVAGAVMGEFRPRSESFQYGQGAYKQQQQPQQFAVQDHLPHSSPPSMQAQPGGSVPGNYPESNYYQPRDGRQHGQRSC